MTSDAKLYLANQFAISCGTVSLDLERSKVLLIRRRSTGEYMLPKGHKDIDEDLSQTAIRETLEETGIPVKLLPVIIDTNATVPSSMKEPPATVAESIAMTQRTAQDGTRKIIFWFVAAADSTSIQQERTQKDSEDFDTVWMGFEDVASTLTFDHDQCIAEAAIAAAQKTAAVASK